MSRFVCLLLLLMVLFTSCAPQTEPPKLQIYFFDVGQGDSMLLRTATGDILIDAGTEASEATLCLRLEQLGVTELLLAVFTHPDEDHIGGADAVLRRFPAKEVWLNGQSVTTEAAARLLQAATETQTIVRTVCAGETKVSGALTVTVLAPFAASYRDSNENSIVLKLHYGEINAILTGDVSAAQEADILAAYGAAQLACDLYKVGHHGSGTSSSSAFLQAMQPTYAVISCGGANSYGHPFGEVLSDLNAVGATVLRTDLLGEILLESNGCSLICTSRN